MTELSPLTKNCCLKELRFLADRSATFKLYLRICTVIHCALRPSNLRRDDSAYVTLRRFNQD